jgi:hypothetical protein
MLPNVGDTVYLESAVERAVVLAVIDNPTAQIMCLSNGMAGNIKTLASFRKIDDMTWIVRNENARNYRTTTDEDAMWRIKRVLDWRSTQP